MSISTASTFTIDQRSLPGNKWLNVVALAEAALSSTSKIVAVNYYTARVSGRVDPTAPARQHAYLRALESLPLVKIHYGNFPSYQKWFGLVQPPMFRPKCTTPPDPTPQVAYVWKMEEKGSDVNLGVHLVRDAFLKTFDEAAILTNDTDLAEPVRIVAQELNLQVTLLTPESKPATSLARYASHVRHITPYLGPCILPDPVVLANGRKVSKPAGW